MNKLILHSGGLDSTCMLLDVLRTTKPEEVFSLGFNYGQRHFEKENAAAFRLCSKFGIKRQVLQLPLGEIVKSSALTNPELIVDANNTVVELRNMMFLTFAASMAAESKCDEIYHGASKEDYDVYRDCRPVFFKFLEMTIQAGLKAPVKGSFDIVNDLEFNTIDQLNKSKIDISIKTPFTYESKTSVINRTIATYGVDVFKDTWTCYNGGQGVYNGLSCGECPSCQVRLQSFNTIGATDPLEYYKKGL